MKKLPFCLILCLLLLFIPTAAAKDVPPEWVDNTAEAEQKSPDLMDIPIYAMNDILTAWAEEPYHSEDLLGFYSSMGCSDLSCADFEHHTHWCVADICLDRSHGHSEAEYRRAARITATAGMTCPCHRVFLP